jgi:drug/metabolite transporter (DMT)-like permease
MDENGFWWLLAAYPLALVIAFPVIRALRRKTYRDMPLPARWLFLGCVAVLVALGAAGLVYNYVQKWGPAAAAWLILAPIVYGVLRGATAQKP